MSDKKKHRTANEYLQYLKGGLSNQERHAFEKEMEADLFEKEAMEGMELIATDQAEEDILSLHSRLLKRLGRKRRIAWYSVAASIASLLIIGTVFLQIYDFNPKKAEKMLDEEALSVAPPTRQSESMPAEEMIEEDIEEVKAIKAETEDGTTGGAILREENTREVATDTEKRDAKGPPKEALPQEVEADAIMFLEAEAVSMEETAISVDDEAVPETRKMAERRSKQLNHPAPTQPVEMHKEALSQTEYTRVVSGEVRGVVISAEDMEPLPGASVALKGSNIGVVTNMDGLFTLPLQDDSNTTIVASFVGMETQEYHFNDDHNIQLVMQPDVLTLDEVVMVGKGIQSSGAPTGAYSTVKMEDDQQDSSQSAQPSVGFSTFKQYIEENIQFPDVETTTDRVVVILKFTVTSAGELNDFVPLRSPGEPFTQEGIRLIKEGPAWNPAYDEKGNIEEIVRLRIVFKK